MNDLAIDLFGEPIPVASLAELAAAINAAVAKADAALDLFKRQRRATLDDYAIAGQLLLTAKAQVEHGQWLPWLGEHCPDLAEHRGRRAQEIMQIARNLETFKSADSATLTKSDALKLLNAPEPDSDPITGALLPADSPATPDPADLIADQQRHIAALERRIDAYRIPLIPEPAEPDQPAAPVVDPAPAPAPKPTGGSDEWYTPVEFIEAARAVMGGIDLDPASCEVAQATVKADRFFTKEQDGLAQPWAGNVWLNPPYSRELIGPFIAKLITDYQAGAVRQAVVLTNNDTETGWFHALADMALCFCFTKGRVHFTSPHTKADSPRQGQVFTYLGNDKKGFDRFKQRFTDIGLVVVQA